MEKKTKGKTGKRKIQIIGAAALILAAAGIFFLKGSRLPEPVYRPIRGFSNMCAYEGKVYAGANAPYGEAIVQKSSIFTIWEDKVYYVEKVQEAYDAGHEKLVGDKLFYGYGYDENYHMRYAYVDVETKERGEIQSGRVDDILGYDGNYMYYKGTDEEKGNIVGRVHMESGRDETVASYAEVDEEGYIDSIFFESGKLYCFTLTHKPDGYDYRTYTYFPSILRVRPIILFYCIKGRFIRYWTAISLRFLWRTAAGGSWAACRKGSIGGLCILFPRTVIYIMKPLRKRMRKPGIMITFTGFL